MAAAYLHRPVVQLPEHRVDLDQLTDWATTRYAGHRYLPAWLRIMAATTVRTRYWLRPAELVLADEAFPQREAATTGALVDLAATAARRALDPAGLTPADVTTLVVSSAGWTLPGLDARLIGALGLPRSVYRITATQYGCAGGVWSLIAGAKTVRAEGGVALVVTADPQSIHQEPAVPTSGAMVWRALIGDAAAATVITTHPPTTGPGMRYESSWQDTAPDTIDLVGAYLEDAARPGAGVGVKLASDPALPGTLPKVLPLLVDWLKTTAPPGATPIPPWVATHTGGPKILDALAAGLDQSPADQAVARRRLSEIGNVAGPAAVDVVAERLADPPPAGTNGLLFAVGPGFTSQAMRVTLC